MLQAQQTEVDNIKLLMNDILSDLSAYFGDLNSIDVKVDKNLTTGARASILRHEIKVGTEVLQMNKDQLKSIIAHELSHGWILNSKFWLRWIYYMGLGLIYLVSIILSFVIIIIGFWTLPLFIVLVPLIVLNIISRLVARFMRDVEYQCDKDATLATKSKSLADSLENFAKISAVEYVENSISPRKKLKIFIQDLIQAFFGYLHPDLFLRIEKIKRIKY